MKQIDRYVLRQLVGPFLFFMVIFGGILWLNQALRIVDVIISNGQSGLVFAELSFYLLPKVLETVVPVAAFSAAIFLTNRLYGEAELVVFMGVGHGTANTTLPFFVFGLFCFVLMTFLTHALTPMALTKFQDRQYQFSKEYLTQFIVPGEFASPEDGVTVFFGETSPEGKLRDVIINDRRDQSVVVTHTASSGQLVSSDIEPKLVLFDGSIQQYYPENRTLSTIQFQSLSYDLGQFAKDVGERTIRPEETYSWELGDIGVERSGMELHDRLVKSLLAIVVPMLGAIVLLSAGFSRGGFFVRIALGVVFMVAVSSARGMVQGVVEDGTMGWPVLYAPVVVAFLAILFMIRIGQAPWKSGLRGVINPQSVAS